MATTNLTKRLKLLESAGTSMERSGTFLFDPAWSAEERTWRMARENLLDEVVLIPFKKILADDLEALDGHFFDCDLDGAKDRNSYLAR